MGAAGAYFWKLFYDRDDQPGGLWLQCLDGLAFSARRVPTNREEVVAKIQLLHPILAYPLRRDCGAIGWPASNGLVPGLCSGT
jgi:hypothetical protein